MDKYGYVTLIFFLILTYLILSNNSNAGTIISAAGTQVTNQIVALQGKTPGS